MSTLPTPTAETYAAGYARGRHAGKEQVPATDNPFLPGSPAFHGWNDGHYDERSARRAEIERYNTLFGTSRQPSA